MPSNLADLDMRELQDKCRDRGIPWRGVKTAEELREALTNPTPGEE
ncbi:hypothetical protein LCGC14_1649530 [marine sediment metagenome]|uniref:Rho termination factor N-terminal domain-containing protein n=1 Tax=marine sediment metagenome TaxID=412755 RepID=A0A0F9KXH2_9ZZZZ